jgi:hypothetical protein
MNIVPDRSLILIQKGLSLALALGMRERRM